MQYKQEEISIVIIQPTPLECRDLDLPRPQHPCSRPWGGSLLAFCWRRVIRRRVQSHTFACSARPQPPRRQPCARVRLDTTLGSLGCREHLFTRPYTYSLLAPKYIYPLVAARSWEHDQRLKAGTLSLRGESSLHYSNVDCHASGDQRGQRLERGQPFQYIACKASRWYLGRRRSICLRLEEPHHLVHHPGKTFSDNVPGKHSGSNMSCAIVGQHHHHFLPIAPLASLAHPSASRYCRSHWWYPTWPFSNGPHSWVF